MAMIAIPVPDEIGRLFRNIDVPGERDNSDHITLFYLGDDIPVAKLVKIIPILHDIAEKNEPFLASCRRITTFPKGDKGYPVIAQLDAPKLIEIRKALKRALDRAGVDYSKDYPDFNPHITLAYSKKKPKIIRFPKSQWQINELALYGGDHHDERMYVSCPLSLKIIEKKADYIHALATVYSKITK